MKQGSEIIYKSLNSECPYETFHRYARVFGVNKVLIQNYTLDYWNTHYQNYILKDAKIPDAYIMCHSTKK